MAFHFLMMGRQIVYLCWSGLELEPPHFSSEEFGGLNADDRALARFVSQAGFGQELPG